LNYTQQDFYVRGSTADVDCLWSTVYLSEVREPSIESVPVKALSNSISSLRGKDMVSHFLAHTVEVT